MIFEYETLKFIWWVIMCLVLIAFAITGGMDIGAHILLPFVGKNDNERRLILNSIGPTWEGNQVWLITFGAGMFAVWPIAYATVFSGLYSALFIVLFMLILRPPGFDYRAKIDSHAWRSVWDLCLLVSGIVLSLVFGLAVGNLFLGLPFHFDADLHPIYTGSLIDLFSPPALVFGLVSVCMLTIQGALYLQYKLQAELAQRAKQAVHWFGIGFFITFIIAGVLACVWMPGYQIIYIPDINASFAASQKVVEHTPVAWLGNYQRFPALWLLPFLALFCTRLAMRYCHYDRPVEGIIMQSMAIMATLLTAAVALFPFIAPSNQDLNHSLTIWDATASYKTLNITFWIVLIFLPIVLCYTAWVYRVMRGKVIIHHDSY